MGYFISDKEYEWITDQIENVYKEEWKKANKYYQENPTADLKFQSSLITEVVNETTFKMINKVLGLNFEPKVGTNDYIKTTIIWNNEPISLNNFQVDRHIWLNNQRYGFIENKTILQASCYKKVLDDFETIFTILLDQGIDVKKLKFIILAAQPDIASKSLKGITALFYKRTAHYFSDNAGIEVKTFFYVKGKRKPYQPIYKDYHEFDREAYKEFLKYILA